MYICRVPGTHNIHNNIMFGHELIRKCSWDWDVLNLYLWSFYRFQNSKQQGAQSTYLKWEKKYFILRLIVPMCSRKYRSHHNKLP